MKKGGVFWVFGILLLAIISFRYDKEIVIFFETIRSNFLNEIFYGVTYVSSTILVLILVTLMLSMGSIKRRWIFPLWITVAISSLISFILKVLIARPRPYQLNLISSPESIISGISSWSYSFPSQHALIAFSVLPLLTKNFSKIKYFWIFLAVLIGVSRVYFGVHFMSDILIGGLIGYLIGITIIYFEEESHIFKRLYEHNTNKIKKKFIR